MIKKYILVICIFCIFVFSTMLLKYNNLIIPIDVKQVFNNEVLGNTKIKEDFLENEKCNIKIYYPETEYENLNNEILAKINLEKENFSKEIECLEKQELDNKFSLDITFNQYKYDSYISFAFDVVTNLGGAHPYNYISTIIYDTKSKKVINIQDIIDKENNFLEKISEISYSYLSENSNIKEYSDLESLKDGLKPVKSNFENIIFAEDKLILYINAYQVAPYVAGNFEISIPYNEIFGSNRQK